MGYGRKLLEAQLVVLEAQMKDCDQEREDLFTQIAVLNDKIAKCQSRHDSLVNMIAAFDKLNLGDEV